MVLMSAGMTGAACYCLIFFKIFAITFGQSQTFYNAKKYDYPENSPSIAHLIKYLAGIKAQGYKRYNNALKKL